MTPRWMRIRRAWYRARAAYGRWYAKGQLTPKRVTW